MQVAPAPVGSAAAGAAPGAAARAAAEVKATDMSMRFA